MKKTALINSSLSHLLAGMGHTDGLCVADAGLPVPRESRRVDMALTRGIPSFLDTVRVILTELEVERALLAEEIKVKNPEVLDGLKKLLGRPFPLDFVPHAEFKARTRDCVATVRTGEYSPFANIIFFSGVVF